MARKRIIGAFNIPEAILNEAERLGLEATGTGGGVDYVYKHIGKNQDGSARVALLATAHDAGTPDRLNEKSEIVIMLRQDWTDSVVIPASNARAAMIMMAGMYDPYVKE